MLAALTDDLRSQLDPGRLALLLFWQQHLIQMITICWLTASPKLEYVGQSWSELFPFIQGWWVALGERISPQYLIVCGIFQLAILFSMLFNFYMHPITELVSSFVLLCHSERQPLDTKVLWLGWGDKGLRCQLPALEHALLTLVLMVKCLGVFLDTSLSMEMWSDCITLGNWPSSCLTMTKLL